MDASRDQVTGAGLNTAGGTYQQIGGIANIRFAVTPEKASLPLILDTDDQIGGRTNFTLELVESDQRHVSPYQDAIDHRLKTREFLVLQADHIVTDELPTAASV